MTVYHGQFRDSAVYDPAEKTAVSVRDGVLQYSGAELGMEPADRMFSVYRSPATISNAAMRMRGVPVTPEHVTLDQPAPSDGGFVNDAAMVDVHDGQTFTTIAVRNRLTLSDTMLQLVESGRREMSLGYEADLVPHDTHDFEQLDIQPHHLATADEGRCGPLCSFLDAKPEDESMALHKQFCDADGNMNLQQIVELATALPDAIRAVPLDQLQKLLPALQEIVTAAKEVTPSDGTPADGDAGTDTDTTDAGNEPAGDDEDEDMADEKKFADRVAAEAERKASAQLTDALKRHTSVVEKARTILPDDYVFTDKATEQIMRDAVATQRTEQFTDEELPLAFKMLQAPDRSASRYADFADSSAPAADLTKLADKEI